MISSQTVLARYRNTIVIVAVLLGLAQATVLLRLDSGSAILAGGVTRFLSRVLAVVAFVLTPAIVSFDGTRHYRDANPRARLWWYLGGLISAVLGCIGVAIGLLQVATGASGLGGSGAASGTFLLALLGGLILGVWAGAVMGWLGHLLGRLTLALGL
jgi:hypothetical protein